MAQQSFRDLIVWQQVIELGMEAYRFTRGFPKEKTFGMKSQMRRSAISVSSNIAEGQERLTKGEFRHFLGQARGSLFEFQSQIEVAAGLGLIEPGSAESLRGKSVRVAQLLHGLIKTLR